MIRNRVIYWEYFITCLLLKKQQDLTTLKLFERGYPFFGKNIFLFFLGKKLIKLINVNKLNADIEKTLKPVLWKLQQEN